MGILAKLNKKGKRTKIFKIARSGEYKGLRVLRKGKNKNKPIYYDW